MDTAQYLSLCLNLINLPTLLNSPRNNSVKTYMQGLSVIPMHMKMSNGLTVEDHLRLMVEADPSKAFLLEQGGFGYQEFADHLESFSKSKGYQELKDEYKAVGADSSRPHRFLNKPIKETPPAPAPKPEVVMEVPMPEKVVEPIEEAQGQARPAQEVKKMSLGHSPKKTPTAQQSVDKSTPPTPPTSTPPVTKPVEPQVTIRPATPTSAPKVEVRSPGQGMVRPSVVIPRKMPEPVKNLGSQAVVQIIRHPFIKSRVATSLIGAAGGYFLGGPGGAGAGAVIGGLIGPQIGASVLNFMTAGRSQSSPSDSDDGEQDSGAGGGRRDGGGGGNIVRNQLQNAGRRLASNAARRASLAAGRAAASFIGANFWWIILIAIGVGILLIVILMMLCILPLSSCSGTGGTSSKQQVTITKSAPLQVDNGGVIEYKITVNNKGSSKASAVVNDDVPEGTIFDSADNEATPEGAPVKKVHWSVENLTPGQSKVLTFKVKPEKTDFWVVNQVSGNITYANLGSSTGLLPVPIPDPIGNWSSTRDEILAAVNKYPEVVSAYKTASSMTGVPWEVLAGLHFVETGNNPRPSASLVSGREIGIMEPDIPRSACAAGVDVPGTPIPMGGGCGFSSFEDSAIYAAKHIMTKIDGRIPSNFQDAVTALSRYNGGGNHNCGRGTPYNFCPEDFDGEDDPYPMNYFDQKHAQMYLIYCADGTKCSPFPPFTRPGAMAVIRALLGQ